MLDWIQAITAFANDRPTRLRMLGYRPVVLCFVRNTVDRTVLLVRPSRDQQLWIPPQEGIGEGERVNDAAIRGLQEECGLSTSEINFRNYRWVGKRQFSEQRHDERNIGYGRKMIGKGYFSAMIDYHPRADITLNLSENTEYKWVPYNQLLDSFTGNDADKIDILKKAITIIK